MESIMRMIDRFLGGNDAEVSASADAQKNLLTAPGNPPYLEIRRGGDAWTVRTATLFAPVAAVPTTTARLEIFNNGSRLLVVSDLHAMQILSTAAGQTYGIMAGITTKKVVPTLTALNLYSLSGKALIVPTVESEIVTAVDTTIVDNGLQPYGDVQAWGTGVATPGNAWSAKIDGKLVVPPKCSLVLHIMGSLATASTFHVGATFDLVSATLE